MLTNIWQPKPPEDSLTIRQLIEWALQYAILAPSAHNTQPWRWEIGADRLIVFREPAYTLESDPTLRETFLGIAAFIENFTLAIQSRGFATRVEVKAFTNRELRVAEIEISDQPFDQSEEKKLPALFESIPKRHTNRGEYKDEPISQGLREEIEDIEVDGSAKAFIITDKESKARVAGLVQKGYYIALSMPEMQRELAGLIFSEEVPRETGMTIESMYSDTTNFLPEQWLEKLNPLKEGEESSQKFANSPALIVIGTKIDGPEAWIDAGRLMEKILLTAASHGLTHDISAAPVEIPILSPLLRKEIEDEYRPQVLLRIGEPIYKEFTRLSTRRPVAN